MYSSDFILPERGDFIHMLGRCESDTSNFGSGFPERIISEQNSFGAS